MAEEEKDKLSLDEEPAETETSAVQQDPADALSRTPDVVE